jgi:hypothetical protein
VPDPIPDDTSRLVEIVLMTAGGIILACFLFWYVLDVSDLLWLLLAQAENLPHLYMSCF